MVNRYGADTFRMYEMFLGPVDKASPGKQKALKGCIVF